MFLKQIVLQHFRSYKQEHFKFNKNVTFIVGPNTAGKSNIMEALYVLATGKSFRAEKDIHMVSFGKEIGRVKGVVEGGAKVEGNTTLEVIITNTPVVAGKAHSKKYLVNDVPRRRVDFAGHFTAVLFSPQDLEIVIDSPSIRRDFLDMVLEQTDREYRIAKGEYEKGIRQRNALLDSAKETGRKNAKLFEYWDELVIKNGNLVTSKREAFIEFVNTTTKTF